MARLLVFDVNETLLDLSALDPHFERVFGEAAVRRSWFQQVLQSALVATITERYVNFGQIAGMALEMTGARQGVDVTSADRDAILGTVRNLPPHDDVLPALTKLRDAGLRLITLTNSPPTVLEAQLANAGLIDFFEATLSVDAVKKFKPAREVYEYAAAEMGLPVGEMRMVAAHDWDILGAMNAGMAGALITRPGVVMASSAPQPDVVGNDLGAVAKQIIGIEQR